MARDCQNLNFIEMILVKTDRYELKVIPKSDYIKKFYAMAANREFLYEYMDYVYDITLDTELFSVNKWIGMYNAGLGFEAGIYIKNEIAGMCGLRVDRLNDKAEIGYWLAKKYNGQGIMTDVVKNVLSIGFESYKLNKIIIETVDSNYKSQAIPKRLGFRFDGILRKDQKLHGEYRDLYVFSILKKEWEILYKDDI